MIVKRLTFSLAVAGVILGAAALLRYADGAGYIDGDFARRSMQVLIGLVLALYANYMPKDIGRARGSLRAAEAAQAALRMGGWSITLAGLASAALWAFAPLAFADLASMLVVATALLVTLVYAGWAFTTCRRARGGPSAS